MSILFVGHGIDNDNWGNRSTSMALAQMLLKKGAVGSYFFSREKSIRLGGLKERVAGKLSRVRFPICGGSIARLMEGVTNAYSYIQATPEESADWILKNERKFPFLRSLCGRIRGSAAIVVNGEGDMILSTPPRRTFLFLLTLLELASRFGRPVYFVNSIASPCPKSGLNEGTLQQALRQLERCAAVALRDPVSYRLLHNALPDGLCSYVPDALFSWRRYFGNFDTSLAAASKAGLELMRPMLEHTEFATVEALSGDYVVVTGGSLACKSPDKAKESYDLLIKRLLAERITVVISESASADSFLRPIAKRYDLTYVGANTPILAAAAIVANARTFITGRYHPAILASLGGTPCIFLGSNSHKTESLQEVLGYDAPHEYGAIPSVDDSESIVEDCRKVRNEGTILRLRIGKTVDDLAVRVEGYYASLTGDLL